jgi:hypothetical protein
MPESKNSPEKESRLPAVVPANRTSSKSAGKRGGIIGALAVFAPLAVEVIYGLTRKWLAETTTSGVSQTTHKRMAEPKGDSQPPGTAGFRRRYRGSQN